MLRLRVIKMFGYWTMHQTRVYRFELLLTFRYLGKDLFKSSTFKTLNMIQAKYSGVNRSLHSVASHT